MYRFLMTAFLGAVLSFCFYLRLQPPIHSHYWLNVILFTLFSYLSIASMIGFGVVRTLENMRKRKK